MAKENDRDQFYANWREFRRHMVKVLDGLRLVETTLREERVRGIPLTADTGRKLERFARFGLCTEGTGTEAPN
jgi:hypothetical protein